MSMPTTLTSLPEVISQLFLYATDWNDVMSLMLVNKQFNYIGSNQQVNIPFEFSTDVALKKLSIPSRVATKIIVNCNSTMEEAYFDTVIKSFPKCLSIKINFNNLVDWELTKKISKNIVKKGLNLSVINSVKPAKLDAYLLKIYTKNDEFMKKRSSSLKRNYDAEDDDEYVILKVPKRVDSRRTFLLKHMLSLPTSEENCDNFTRDFSRISNVFKYKSAEISDHFLYSKIEDIIPLAKQFVNSVIKFQSLSLLITSLDIFYHNHRFDDDCAQSIDCIYTEPTAKISRKTYTDKSFTEISIFIGHYELLAVGGYVKIYDNLMPFLGSSLGKFNLEEESTTEIMIPTTAIASIRTERLLNQYIKRKSHHLWSLHCRKAYLKGFYPISPISLANHVSQRHKHLTNHHFTSQVLNLISSYKVIKKSDLESLWSYFMLIPVFKKITNGSTTLTSNFVELSEQLKLRSEKSSFISLIHTIAEVEGKAPCFFLSIYSEAEAKKIALKIMTDGLKKHITEQHNLIIGSAAKSLQ